MKTLALWTLFVMWGFGFLGYTVGKAAPCNHECEKNHVEYDSQGRPKFTEWCDRENGRCYIIIDGKKVIIKYKCKKHD